MEEWGIDWISGSFAGDELLVGFSVGVGIGVIYDVPAVGELTSLWPSSSDSGIGPVC